MDLSPTRELQTISGILFEYGIHKISNERTPDPFTNECFVKKRSKLTWSLHMMRYEKYTLYFRKEFIHMLQSQQIVHNMS